MSKALKILVVLPLYGGSLPIGHYCVDALKALGHKVEIFNAPEFQPSFQALRNLQISSERGDFLHNNFANLLSEAVYAQAEKFAPDIVFAMAQAPLSRAVLKRFERDKIPTAMWFVEDYEIFTYWRAYANLYSYFFVIQKEPFLSKLKEGGQNQAHYLPLAALPNFHKKVELSAEDKIKYGADVAFLGAGYANRRYEFRRLMSYDFKIWGSDWEGDTVLAPYLQNNGARVSPEESVSIYNATKINLNLHSSVERKRDGVGDFVNPRTFELASMEAFQLVDRRSLMSELFVCDGDDKELLTFEKFEEVPALINYYLAKPEEREELTKRAYERILKEHTYMHRMQTMLDIIQPNLPEREGIESYLGDMPEELKTQMVDFYKKHDLAATTAFEDVVHSLRSETKPLDSLETSILFLAEWKKQYAKS